MENNLKSLAGSSLQHLPKTGALSVRSSGTSIVARGRRDAANASNNPPYQLAVRDYNLGNFADAAANFRLAAEQGHAESQYVLSTLYDAGEAVPQDETEAAFWERKAADQGHAYEQANLSFRYYAAGDFAEAFACCQRAAYSNLAWAQYNLGLMHRKGEGVEPSNVEAAYWYRLAATRGFAEAQLKLADLYCMGQGVALSYAQAALWYRKAADQGNAEAQFQLGHLYATGRGVEQGYVQSRDWTRKAALQGHEQAASELKRREYRDP